MEHPDIDAATLLGPDAHLALPDHKVDEEQEPEQAPGCEGFRTVNDTPVCISAHCARCQDIRAKMQAVQQGTMADLVEVMENTGERPAPVPVMRGRFAVYDTPDGGYHLTYQLEGEEEPQHMEFPGMFVNLAKKRGAAIGAVPGMSGFLKLFGGE